MIGIFRKIWNFAGKEKGNIKKSIVVGFFYAIFYVLQLYAIFAVLNDLVTGNAGAKTSWIAFGIMAVSIIGKIITHYFQQLQRTHVGYFMAAQKRIQIGNKLKAVPMGYFNKNSLGNITAVATTILNDVETGAPLVLINTLGGLINALIYAVAILIFDWRIGLIVVAGMALYLLIVFLMQKNTAKNAPLRQAAQENLIEAALETIQGMSVVKAFNLEKNKKIDNAMKESCDKNIRIEKAVSPYLFLQNITLDLFSIGTDTYSFEKDLLKVDDFDGKKNTYQVVLNDYVLLNTEISAGSVYATVNMDFYNTNGGIVDSATLKISVLFLSNKTQLTLATTSNKSASFLEQYFSDNGIRLQVIQIKQEAE